MKMNEESTWFIKEEDKEDFIYFGRNNPKDLEKQALRIRKIMEEQLGKDFVDEVLKEDAND